MLKAVVVSFATAWTVAPLSGPAAPASPVVQYQPAVAAALPNGYRVLPQAYDAYAPPPVVQYVQAPTAKRGMQLDALNVVAVLGLGAALGYGVGRARTAALGVGGGKVKAPKGPFGGSGGPDDGWVGDRGKSTQVQKFEEATDYLFFQGPAPTTAVQDDLPSFLSAENFADMEIKPLQIAVTVVGFGTFAVFLSVLLQ